MDIKIIDQPTQLALAKKLTGANMQSMMSFIDQSYREIGEQLAALHKPVVGAPFVCYTNMSEDMATFDLEAGFPIAERFELPEGSDLYLTETYAGKAVEGTHHGPYETLEATYGAIMQFIKEHGLEMTGVYYDFYLNDPDVVPAEELVTKVVIAVK